MKEAYFDGFMYVLEDERTIRVIVGDHRPVVYLLEFYSLEKVDAMLEELYQLGREALVFDPDFQYQLVTDFIQLQAHPMNYEVLVAPLY